MNHKILLLFCGGTIVMCKDAHGAVRVREKNEAIDSLMDLEPRLADIAQLELIFLANEDSSNIQPPLWEKIAKTIQTNYADYDGFVITHGTDTMAYTASALSFLLKGIGKPVVLTGAQIPGHIIESDARQNLVNAVRTAILDLSGVYITFNDELILGCRAAKVSESRLKAFQSINTPAQASYRVWLHYNYPPHKRHGEPLYLSSRFETNIAVLTLFPGMPSSIAEAYLHTQIRGIVIRGYGTGNIPATFIPFLKAALDKRIPIVITTQCRDGSTSMKTYEIGRQALALGAIESYDMSIESTICKFMWVLGQNIPYEDISKWMYTDMVGEINPYACE